MSRIWVIEASGKKETFKKALKALSFKGDRVLATYGRLFDLPQDALGFDPSMMSQPGTSSQIHWVPKNPSRAIELIKCLAEGDQICIATDSDLEGELIASQVEELCVYAQRQRSKPQAVTRVHIQAITPQDIELALSKAGPVDANMVRAAKARRVLDRLLGYTLHDAEDPWRLSIGRVVTPLVSSLFESPGEAVIIRKKLADGWNAIVRLDSTQAIHADTVVGILHALPAPLVNTVSTEPMEFEYKPLTGPEALSLCMRGLPHSPAEIQTSIQHSYERGVLSYPRTDSRTLGEVALKWIDRMAGRESVQFDRDLAVTRQSERLERSYDAHHALLPLTEDIPAASIPSSYLSIDQAVLRVIAHHSVQIGSPSEEYTREIGRLDDHDNGSRKWGQVLRAWEKKLSFVRDTDECGFQQDPLRHEITRDPEISQALVSKWTHPPTQIVMERLSEIGLGRPSTLFGLAEKTFASYLDRYGTVNGRGKIMIEKVMRRLPELLTPDAARSIENVVADVKKDASIGTRLANAWEILKKNPILLGGNSGESPTPSLHTAEKSHEKQHLTDETSEKNNTFGMY